MKNQKSKSAFTMLELIFIIVIIGILASVAIPRLSATRDDAEITKARVTVASIRNALTMERQKRILRGEFGKITALTADSNVFGTFKAKDSNGTVVDTGVMVLEYAISSNTNKGHWSLENGGADYKFNSGVAKNPIFVVSNGKFVCKTGSDCSALLD